MAEERKKQEQTILLQTTPGDQIPLHLAANCRCRTCNKFAPFVPFPPEMNAASVCECAEPNRVPVIPDQTEFAGKTLAICGAGPSLNDAYKQVRKADIVWGCNRAAHFLEARGWKLTHAFGIDAGTAMFEDAWKVPPNPTAGFLLASSVHPQLVDHLLEHDKRVQFFHSMRGGFKDEEKLYQLLFPPTPRVGNGLNSVNRALGLAAHLAFKRVYVCGADNALRDGAFYADGSPRENSTYMDGVVFGRTWRTTPDMLMSATDLARTKWAHPEWLEIVGNTLPRALSLTSEKFLDRCVRWESPEEEAYRLRAAEEAVANATETVANATV